MRGRIGQQMSVPSMSELLLQQFARGGALPQGRGQDLGTSSSALWFANFTTLTQGDAPPGWITWYRSGANARTRTGVATMSTPITADTMRMMRDGVRARALWEPFRQNLVAPAPRDILAASWSNDSLGGSTTATANYAGGPDGVVLADRSQVPSAGYSRNFSVLTSPGDFTGSLWLRGAIGGSTTQIVIYRGATAVPRIVTLVSTTWQPVDVSITELSAVTFAGLIPADGRDLTSVGGLTAGARDVVSDMHQIESGKYPTTFVDGSRNADLPEVAIARLVTTGGALNFYVDLDPIAASTEYESDQPVAWLDANNKIEIIQATRKLKITLGGTPFTFTDVTIPSFVRRDRFQLHVRSGGGQLARAWCAVNGDVTDLGAGSLAGNWPTVGNLKLLNDGANVFGSEVSQLGAYT